MKKTIIVVFTSFLCLSPCYSQNPWLEPSYTVNDLVFYSGSGAMSRHLEKNYFAGKYNYYLKSPFVSAGFDYCFANADALWGVGLYFSGAVGKKEYAGASEDSGKLWSNYLCALKFTHHNKFFVRRKIDLCSGYIIGTRTRSYEWAYRRNNNVNGSFNRTFDLAIGISGTIKYYMSDRLAIYAEAAMGHNVDLFQIGIAGRIKSKR